MIYFLIYVVLGFIVSFIAWHNICKAQTDEEKKSENPNVLVVLPCLIVFWPIILVLYIYNKIIY